MGLGVGSWEGKRADSWAGSLECRICLAKVTMPYLAMVENLRGDVGDVVEA